MRIDRTSNRGAMLLEAVIALAIVSVVGISMLALIAALQRDQGRLATLERRIASADHVMTAMVLLTREDLDRRLGRHGSGEFSVEVERPERTLYRIAVADTSRPDRELLTTVIYRPDVVK
jgi:type II secretory pathway component PulJ